MKVTLILLCFSLTTVFATPGFAQPEKVSIQMDDVTLREVFREIERQSDYSFFYNDQFVDLNSVVSLNSLEEPINEVLNGLLSETDLSYKLLEGNLIVIIPQPDKKVITGKVIDKSGIPLPGVTVNPKGTSRGVATKEDGTYSIELGPDENILVFSFLGLKTMEVNVGTDPVINVVMEEDITQIQEVVVTGYQTISKERAAGAYSIVGLEQLEKPATNIAQRLIGTTAGVQAALDVDGNPTFEIRGQTSLNAVREPLVVIDGFPTEKGFNSINPNDVESVTFLKDATAASIWGAKAANGVIVISSKKVNKETPLRVEFDAFYKFGPKFDLDYVRPVSSSNDVIDYEITSFNKWGARAYMGTVDDGYYRTYTPTQQLMWDHYNGLITLSERDAEIDTYRGLDNSQQIKDNLLDNPSTQQYNLTLMGGSAKMSNYLSLLHEKNNSNYKNTGSVRDFISYRNTSTVTNWLNLEVGATLAYSTFDNSGVTLANIQSWAPHQMLRDDTGNLLNIPNGYNYLPAMSTVPVSSFPYPFSYNPIEEIANRDIVSKNIDTRINAALIFKLAKGLTFESRLQYEYNNTYNKSIYNENTSTVRQAVNQAASWNRTTGAVTLNLPKGGFLDQNRSQITALILRNQVNFNRSFGKHDITALAGVEFSDRVTQIFNNPRTYGYYDDKLSVGTFPNGPGGSNVKLIYNWLGTSQTFGYTNSFSYGTRRFYAAYANANYTYNSKYSVTGSIRTDASNFITDDPKYRYAPFWSIGAVWNMSKEDFMDNVDIVDRLSTRFTFGYNGNVDNTTAFQPLISPSTTVNTYTQEFTTTVSSLGNPTLRWEKTGTWNFGVDYSLFGGNLYGSLDIYNKYTKDLIATVSIPAVNGSTSTKMNNAEMSNKGFELEIGTVQDIKGQDIWWRGSLNFAYNKNKIEELFVAQYASYNLASGTYVEGYNSQELWAYEYAGIVNVGTETTPNWQPMVQGPEDITYPFTGFAPGDGRDYMLHMGTKVAPYTLGFSSMFKIYDFNFSFIITGKMGHVFNRQTFNYPVWWNGAVLPNQKYDEVVNGDPMEIVPLPLQDNEPRFYFWDRFYPYLDYLVENASHIRMQEISLSYDLPAATLQKLGINSFRVYAQCNDLFTIVANSYGEDPEYRIGTQKPQPKFTFGLRFGL
ncbi:MAG: SusC/RagA family TonB-linked outer membrane protein [Bacteroidales bacterium]|jgi:TonB-linked SusC/RagA family outer membrane protein|nr:SusC/RagA family TonB-linked outer membrane protein [Bacteroidales bacterium]